MNTQRKTRGFSITELMIAMLIGLFLMGGIMTIMLNSKRAYNVQSDLARLQESGRMATDFMARDMRMVGYFGCGGTLQNIGGSGFVKLRAADGLGLNGSDVLVIGFMDTSNSSFRVIHCPAEQRGTVACPNPPAALAPTPLTAGTMSFTGPGMIESGDRVVVSDCSGARIYNVTNIATAGGNSTVTLASGLNRDYDNGLDAASQSYGAEMRRLVQYRYFVATNAQGGVSLFRDRNSNPNAALDITAANAEELVEGVEAMQLRFAEDTDGDKIPNRYRPPNQVASWDNVVGMRIGLVLRTTDNRPDQDLDTRTYEIDPAEAAFNPDPDDNRLRRVFSLTVLLRNNTEFPL